jgi:D-alanyl-D-alanine dipeptidase
MKLIRNLPFFCAALLVSCADASKEPFRDTAISQQSDTVADDTSGTVRLMTDSLPGKSEIELQMETLGLVDISELDSTIKVDLRYSTPNNFTGKDMYGDLNRCYLQKDVAEKLVLAQVNLRKQFPYYSLLVLDGARPVSIQQLMWDSVGLSPAERQKYLSNPVNRSLHNYGAAVDVTIIDERGHELDMGTPYDFFGELAHPRKESEYFESGKLTETQLANREILRGVMREAGFSRIETEWWHFNSTSRARAAEIYPVIP